MPNGYRETDHDFEWFAWVELGAQIVGGSRGLKSYREKTKKKKNRYKGAQPFRAKHVQNNALLRFDAGGKDTTGRLKTTTAVVSLVCVGESGYGNEFFKAGRAAGVGGTVIMSSVRCGCVPGKWGFRGDVSWLMHTLTHTYTIALGWGFSERLFLSVRKTAWLGRLC